MVVCVNCDDELPRITGKNLESGKYYFCSEDCLKEYELSHMEKQSKLKTFGLPEKPIIRTL